VQRYGKRSRFPWSVQVGGVTVACARSQEAAMLAALDAQYVIDGLKGSFGI
jgi:hypothetical protein